MSDIQARSDPTGATNPVAQGVVAKLEVVAIPVSDVDRAKRFYDSLGWRLDADFVVSDAFRGVQFTPPGSPSSIHFGNGVTNAVPGSAQGIYLVVSDIEAARADLAGRGVNVSDVFHRDGPGKPAVKGRDPQGRSYFSYATFKDPDGNEWLLQEITEPVSGPGRLQHYQLRFRGGSCGCDAARIDSPRRAREAERRSARRELARLVRRVHGGGADWKTAATVTLRAPELAPRTPVLFAAAKIKRATAKSPVWSRVADRLISSSHP